MSGIGEVWNNVVEIVLLGCLAVVRSFLSLIQGMMNLKVTTVVVIRARAMLRTMGIMVQCTPWLSLPSWSLN